MEKEATGEQPSTNLQPFIRLSKGIGKDYYGWEIKLYGEDLNKVIEDIEKLDKKLRSKFKAEAKKREKEEE